MAAKQKSGKKSDNNTEILQEDLSLLAKDIIANVGVGIYIVQHGKFVYVSDLYQKITGYTDKELIGTYSLNNIYPDDKEKVREQAIRCLKGERSGPYEYRFVTKNDEIIWVLEAVVSIEYRGERAALGSFIDITERKNMEQKLQREEQLFKALTDQSSDIIVIVNREGLITYENKAIEEVLGFKANERLGCRGFDNIHPDDMSFVVREFERLFQDVNAPVSRSEVRLRDKNGNWTFFESVASNLSNNNVVEALIINLRDITERKLAEESLRESEEKYRTILENIEDGYYEVDLSGNFTFFNDSVGRLHGYSNEELMGMNYREYTDKEYSKKLFNTFNKVYKTGEPTRGFGWQIIRKDGTKRYIEVSVSLQKDSSCKPKGFRGISRDITERKQIEQQLNHLATHDPLTGLPNRMLFMDRLQIALAQSNRNRNKLAVIMLDLDNFKDINDTLGHMVGDKLLREVGNRLTGILRQNDTVARLGGDEFIILLSDLGKIEYAAGVAKVILKSLRKPFVFVDNTINSHASLGIAVYPDDCEDVDSLLRKSDMAMYAVKTQGRNNYMFFSNVSI
jgi:diguanylate cyclase (GGDEF)-like protein/PAS domain S-box-containing protein